MSTTVLKACWPIKLSPAVKAVLISLADQADDDWGCWPSVGSIAQRTCYSERTVHYAIGQLVAAGLLQVKKRAGHSSYYTICLRGATTAPLQDAQRREPSSSSVKGKTSRGATTAPLQPVQGATAAPRGATGAPPGVQPLHPELSVEPSITKTRVRANPAIDIAQPPNPENPNPSLPDKPGQPYTDRAKLPSIMEALRAKITGTRPRSQLPEKEPSSESA